MSDSDSTVLRPVIKLSAPARGGFWEIPVLYEDNQVLAINKPAGLRLAPDRLEPDEPNLIGLLHQAISEAKPWVTQRGLEFLMYTHRLDLEASGVLLLAKSKATLATLLDLFGQEQPILSFVTLVFGSPPEDIFSIDAKLAPHRARPGFMRVNQKGGKRSRTSFEVLERFRGWTLLRCTPLTHRLHQVRVHLAYAGFPVAGDTDYGGKQVRLSRLKRDFRLKPGHVERPLIGSACLHVERLSLPQLAAAEPVVITAPWPKDLEVALKYLRKHAPPSEC